MILNSFLKKLIWFNMPWTGCASGSGLCDLPGFLVATEEAPVKVPDSRKGLVADKRGVNSSVSLSMQGLQ